MGPPKGYLQYKVVRGGSWGDRPDQGDLRCAARDYTGPAANTGFRNEGFRCVKRP
jgi:formylglycine-generating enzyme required for sulfatase activity